MYQYKGVSSLSERVFYSFPRLIVNIIVIEVSGHLVESLLDLHLLFLLLGSNLGHLNLLFGLSVCDFLFLGFHTLLDLCDGNSVGIGEDVLNL